MVRSFILVGNALASGLILYKKRKCYPNMVKQPVPVARYSSSGSNMMW